MAYASPFSKRSTSPAFSPTGYLDGDKRAKLEVGSAPGGSMSGLGESTKQGFKSVEKVDRFGPIVGVILQ